MSGSEDGRPPAGEDAGASGEVAPAPPAAGPGPRPPNPYAVLAVAAVLPGCGHVWLGLASRGLTFLFFIAVLGWLTAEVAPPGASFIGRHAGGVLVYALSLLDAYKIARLRLELWRSVAANGP